MRQDKIQHKSMRGRVVDMESLRARNANSLAVGNSQMNANGDVLDKGGQIVIRRDQIIQAYYQNNPKGVKTTSLKQTTADSFETPKQAVERLQKRINSNSEVRRIDNTAKIKTRHMVDKSD